MTRNALLFCLSLVAISAPTLAQQIEKIKFDPADTTDGYYLAIRPVAGKIKGTLVLLTSFLPPADLLIDTKLQNIAAANELLTIVAFTKGSFFADQPLLERLDRLFGHVITNFSVDSSKFVIAGYDDGGNIALRYTELAYQHPQSRKIKPAAVFGVESNVDLAGLWQRSINDIKKNFSPGSVGDANFYLDVLKKSLGSPYENAAKYATASPFNRSLDTTGNEKWLSKLPVRLYYDTDLNWYLKERRASVYDTKLADGSEMIKRLMLSGNQKAELMTASQPGVRSNGQRHPNSISIVDEVECIQWIRSSLGIFDPRTYKPPYYFPSPKGWQIERFELPPDFAGAIPFKGLEDIRFTPGWGDTASSEHWSYSFLWWLKDSPKPDAASLQKSLTMYFNGLVSRNIQGLDPATVTPTTVNLRKVKTAVNDTETWSGSIVMFDYHTKKKMTLQVLIHAKQLSPEQLAEGRSALIFALSPQPAEHGIWKKMQELADGFKPGIQQNQ